MSSVPRFLCHSLHKLYSSDFQPYETSSIFWVCIFLFLLLKKSLLITCLCLFHKIKFTVFSSLLSQTTWLLNTYFSPSNKAFLTSLPGKTSSNIIISDLGRRHVLLRHSVHSQRVCNPDKGKKEVTIIIPYNYARGYPVWDKCVKVIPFEPQSNPDRQIRQGCSSFYRWEYGLEATNVLSNVMWSEVGPDSGNRSLQSSVTKKSWLQIFY